MNDIIRQMREIIGGKPSIRDAALLAGLDALEAEIGALRQLGVAAEPAIARCKTSDNPHDHARLFHEWRDEIGEARRLQRIAEMERDELHKRAAPISVADELPKPGRKVIAHYIASNGRAVSVAAKYIAQGFREVGPGDCGESLGLDYDEATDTYYWPAGWYETVDNAPDYEHWLICEHKVTHWSHLPEHPERAADDAALIAAAPDLLAALECLIEAYSSEGREHNGHVYRPSTRECRVLTMEAWRKAHAAVAAALGGEAT